jgi:hypothetical protein
MFFMKLSCDLALSETPGASGGTGRAQPAPVFHSAMRKATEETVTGREEFHRKKRQEQLAPQLSFVDSGVWRS